MNPSIAIANDFFYWKPNSWSGSRTEYEKSILPFLDIVHKKTVDLLPLPYSLKKPIQITMKFKKGEYLGELDELEIYCFGKNEEEVEKELISEIMDLFDHYQDINESKLGSKPGKWKKFLTDHIEKK